jgi:heptosyltransferase-2
MSFSFPENIVRSDIDDYISTTPSYVIINPGGKFASKKWPSENFVRLVRYLDTFSAKVVIAGSDDEIALFKEDTNVSIFRNTSISDLIQLIQKSAMFIGNDSGPFHIAALTGIPSIGLFSGYDYENKWHPINLNAISIRKKIDCAPCFLKNCPYNNKCMSLITPEEVISEVNKILDKG